MIMKPCQKIKYQVTIQGEQNGQSVDVQLLNEDVLHTVQFFEKSGIFWVVHFMIACYRT